VNKRRCYFAPHARNGRARNGFEWYAAIVGIVVGLLGSVLPTLDGMAEKCAGAPSCGIARKRRGQVLPRLSGDLRCRAVAAHSVCAMATSAGLQRLVHVAVDIVKTDRASMIATGRINITVGQANILL
jgi:hypothetical protein